MTKNKHIKFQPEADVDLKLHEDGGGEYTGYILLENISDEPVAFKFRSNNSDHMSVIPANGSLQAREKIKCSICYLNNGQKPSGKERLQVLVAPLDERYLQTQDIASLFRRTDSDMLQNHKFRLKSSGEGKEPEEPQSEEPTGDIVYRTIGKSRTPENHGHPKEDKPVTVFGRHHHRDNTRKEKQTFTHADPGLDSNSEGDDWNAQNLNSLDDYRPPSAARNRRTKHHFRAPGYPYRRSAPSPGSPDESFNKPSGDDLPQYHLNLLSGQVKDSDSVGQKLMSNFSMLGQIVRNVGEEAKKLRKHQKFTTAIYCIVLLLLFVLLMFLVVLPLCRYYRHRPLSNPMSPITIYDSVEAAAAELSEMFNENQNDVTLDNYIHAKMSS